MKLLSLALFFASVHLPLSLPSSLLCKQEKPQAQQEQIRVVAVKDTPEPETAIMVIQVPKMGEVVGGNPVWLQGRVDGYTLEADSQFDRATEIVNSKMGQTLRIVIDDKPYFPINGPSIDPFNEQGWYYDQVYKFEVPFKLANGFHTIRAYLARSFGESLKGSNLFFVSYFYVGEKRRDDSKVSSLTKPFLTYNEPSERTHLVEDKPTLLDFYLTNVELSPDGYKVKMTIDDKFERVLDSWQPYYIYGLRKGKHTMRLQLIDKKGVQVDGAFNDVKQSFTVH